MIGTIHGMFLSIFSWFIQDFNRDILYTVRKRQIFSIIWQCPTVEPYAGVQIIAGKILYED